MDKQKFIKWINELDLQTLTDELKEEIIYNAEIAFDDEFNLGNIAGFDEAKDYLINHIQNKM